jgi:hypothetical protein
MSEQGRDGEGRGGHGRLTGEAANWVLATLETDQLVNVKRAPVPRRHLRGGELLLLWALRIYLLFMLAVVFWQSWTVVR